MKKPAKFTDIGVEPCHEEWEEMREDENGNRFCAACQTTVFDFSHLSPEELTRFLEENPGPICGNFYADQLEENPGEKEKRKKPLVFLKNAAAAAATIALLQSGTPMQADNPEKPRTEQCMPTGDEAETSPGNTFLTCVVLNQYESNIQDDIEVRVLKGEEQIAKVTTVRGFFHLDLSATASPDDSLTVLIEDQVFKKGDINETAYTATISKFKLSEGQNHTMKMYVRHPRRPRLGGVIRRPDPRDIRRQDLRKGS